MESTDVAKEISLDKLKDEVQYQSVSVDVKVVEVREIYNLNGWQVQNVMVADRCGTTELALWQDFVGKMVLNKSYKMKQTKILGRQLNCSVKLADISTRCSSHF